VTRPAVLGFLLVLSTGQLAAQNIAYEGSLGLSTGRYFFTDRTTSVALTNGLRVGAGRFTFRGSLPIWWQNTTLLTATGAGPVPSGGPYGREAVQDSGDARQQRKGKGSGGMSAMMGGPSVPAPEQSVTGYELRVADPTLQAGYRLVSTSRVTLSAALTAKLPVADSTVGTGEWDVGGSASMTVLLSPRVTAGLDASWWRLGDMEDFDFRDPLSGTASIGMILSGRWAGLASFTAATSALEGYDPPLIISAALSRITGAGIVGLNLSAGLTETVPDFGAAVLWSFRISR
jgi:hypothetical protein